MLSFLGAIGRLPVLVFKEFAALKRLEINNYSVENRQIVEPVNLVHGDEILSIADGTSKRISQLILKTTGKLPIKAYPRLFSRLCSLHIHSTERVLL
jgi:hypothetical protein